jgi:hypothetical protein
MEKILINSWQYCITLTEFSGATLSSYVAFEVLTAENVEVAIFFGERYLIHLPS